MAVDTDNKPRQMNQGTDLTTGSIPRHLIEFSIPMLMGSILQTAYSFINAIWVGNGLGTDAMVAVTVSFPIFFVLMAVAGGLTLATTVLVSQHYGAKDLTGMRQVIGNSIILSTFVGIICLTAGYSAAEFLLKLAQTPAGNLAMAVSYFRVFVWTIPLMFGTFLIAAILRGVGDSKTPLYFQAVSVAIAAVLDPLLMFGWLGFPKLGLNGTAVATIVSQASALISILVYLHRKDHLVSPEWRTIRADWPTSCITLRIGIPSMVQQALISIGMVIMVGLINTFGKYGSAAFGAAMRIDQLAFMPAMSVGMAASTLAGQNIGANRFDRVHEVFKWGMIIGCGLTAIASLLAVTIPEFLIGLFIQDPPVVVIGTGYLQIMGFCYLAFAVMFVSNGIINGAGHTMATTVFTLLTLWAIRVPMAAYLSKSLHRIEGIWYAMAMSFVIGSAISVAYYFSGKWKKPISRKPISASPEPVS